MYTDNRIYAFYVNPHTDELVSGLFSPPHDDSVIARFFEALKGQGVTQSGSWYVADAHNWGTSTMAKWKYTRVSKSAKSWHLRIQAKRDWIAAHNKPRK